MAFPLGNRGCSHLLKLKQITSQIFHEDQSLDLFVSDYRKNPMYNWNPPVRDQLQAVCANDVDDQAELEEFNLVNSHNIDKSNTNLTDTGPDMYSVDVTIQGEGPITPTDGNVNMVFSDPSLDEANTQTTNLDFARIPNNVESDDSFIVENHSRHDNTDTENKLDLHTVDVTNQSEGPIISADGNVSMIFSDPPLTVANTQTTSTGPFQNPDTERDMPPVDNFEQVTGNKGVLLPAHVPKGYSKSSRTDP